MPSPLPLCAPEQLIHPPTPPATPPACPADFAEVRSKSDAALLYDAKYGELEGGKMSKEQYQALRRRVGGTAKDYFKSW